MWLFDGNVVSSPRKTSVMIIATTSITMILKKTNSILLLASLVGCAISSLFTPVAAQQATSAAVHHVTSAAVEQLVPPFDFPIALSGNFGELRSNHFHGGLDFKTQGTINKPVRAQADGYIKRLRVTHGSGYVLDVVYHNGLSAIYRHLNAFVGEAARRIEELQYSSESWEVEIEASPEEYPVQAGEVMALSGNTGYSFGPHLHLDLFESATGDYIDPLPYFASRVNDHTAPRADGILLFPKQGKGVVMGGTRAKRFPVHPKQTLTAWGWIGAGIRAYDYMEGVHNRFGVHTVVLTVDHREVFRSVVDRFSQEEQRYINSWTDGSYMKSVIDPGNRLRLLHAADGHRGWVLIDEERPYHFVYTLSDALGNRTQVRFTVHGKRSAIPEAPVGNRLFRWNETNVLQQPGMQLVVPRGMLYDDVALRTAMRVDSGDVAYTYQLHDEFIPLHAGCELRIALRRPLAGVDSTKYYVAAVTRSGGRNSVGGRYEGGGYRGGADRSVAPCMVARIRELGTYTVAVDTVPPVITPVARNAWNRTGCMEFVVKDAATGISSYRGELDGAYALFGKPNLVSGRIVCKFDTQRFVKGKKHHLRFIAIDGCGNTAIYETEFYY